MKEKWWLVYNPYPSGVKPTYRHKTFGAAQKEAARIAKAERCKIHVLEIVGTMHPPSIPPCIWEER